MLMVNKNAASILAVVELTSARNRAYYYVINQDPLPDAFYTSQPLQAARPFLETGNGRIVADIFRAAFNYGSTGWK